MALLGVKSEKELDLLLIRLMRLRVPKAGDYCIFLFWSNGMKIVVNRNYDLQIPVGIPVACCLGLLSSMAFTAKGHGLFGQTNYKD